MCPDNIPYIVHESQMSRMERTIKRLWILCIVIFLAFIGSNCAWMYYESQFTDEIVTQEVIQDAKDGGTVKYNGKMVGGDYGESKDTSDSETESP